MEDFDWTYFTCAEAVRSEMKTLYDAWTIPSELEKWFLRTAKYFDPNSGQLPQDSNYSAPSSYEWTWYNYTETEKGRVIEANGKDKVVFSFAGECIVEVNLSSFEDHTIVSITQKNIPTDNKSKKDIRLGCHNGWSYFLVNIKSFYENGNDLRTKDSGLHDALKVARC